jgi:hypothetical protein
LPRRQIERDRPAGGGEARDGVSRERHRRKTFRKQLPAKMSPTGGAITARAEPLQ